MFALGLGIPLTFLLTAIISSLLASLITYLYLVGGKSQLFNPPVQKSPSKKGAEVETQPNLAYDQVTKTRAEDPNYETILP